MAPADGPKLSVERGVGLARPFMLFVVVMPPFRVELAVVRLIRLVPVLYWGNVRQRGKRQKRGEKRRLTFVRLWPLIPVITRLVYL